MLLEAVKRLSAQYDPINKKKNTLHASGSHESVDKGDTRSGFSGTGGYDQEEATAIPFDTFHDRTNGLELKIAAGNSGVDQLLGEGFVMLANEE